MNGDDKKLVGHSKHLVAFMVSIVRKWRVTQALRFGEYPKIRGNALAAAGFGVCTDTLYISVIHDLAALMFDEGRKTPSLRTCMQILAQPGVERRFRDRFVSNADGNEGLSIRFCNEFDTALHRLREEIPLVLDSGDATACRRARETYAGHFVLQPNGDDYKRLDIQHFGLLWDTPSRIIKRLRPRLDDLSLITQSGSFAWDAYARQNDNISDQLAAAFEGQAGFLPHIEQLSAQVESIFPRPRTDTGLVVFSSEDDPMPQNNFIKADLGGLSLEPLTKALRDKTGATLLNCKKASVRSNGDYESALRRLRNDDGNENLEPVE